MTLLKVKRNDIVPDAFGKLLNDLVSDLNKVEDKASSATIHPPVNIVERKDNYEIQLALPGWEKKEIALSLENSLLSVAGRKDTPKDDKHVVHKHEFNFGKFEKQFQLPKEASDKVNAELKDGILYIRIQKVPEAQAKRRIEVL